ncbi:MAG: hypothetical protein ACR2Q3_15275 [Woeseiaceae bacterium]
MWILLVFAIALTLFVVAPGCTIQVAGQRVPSHALQADSSEFDVAADVAALHYYGVGGWGVQWRGEYLLMAPYFSNHGFLGFYGKNGPDIDAVKAGVKNTPFSETGLILVGHGHVDHAADIPAYSAAGLAANRAGVIANGTTLNMLASIMPPNESFRCAEAPAADGVPIRHCNLPGFRITPLKSEHAPNVKVLDMSFTVAEGTVDRPQDAVPESPADYFLGETWAYLVDLLDANGNIVFRIHYMDAVAGADESQIPPELLAERDVDVHIACVPGFHYVHRYPEWVIERGNTAYVLMGHWEDFFRPRERRLKPVTLVLSERKLNDFAGRVEAAMPADRARVEPINKSAGDCPPEAERCGPRGESWALPIPGETYHFKPRVHQLD